MEAMTTLIAVIVCYIAYRQWRTADQRLKVDMFDRRYKAYKKIWQHFEKIKGSSKIEKGQLGQFLLDIEVTKWIFDNEIHQYLKQKVWERMNDLQIDHQEGEPERDQQKIRDLLKQDRKNLDQMFKQYLKIGKHQLVM